MSQERMTKICQALEARGLEVRKLSGPQPHSDPQVVFTKSDGTHGSVMTDIEDPKLYAVMIYCEPRDKYFEKLTLEAAVNAALGEECKT